MKFNYVSGVLDDSDIYKDMLRHQVENSISRGNIKYGAALGAGLLGDDNLNDDFLNTF
tara:strand:+ start:3860 stop:4033 length:174 start_codon:yes stop_codon:yes gene_type:complete